MPDHDGRNTNRDDIDRERMTEHYGGGQSGYGSGRVGDDRSMGAGYRNQAAASRSAYDDRQGMHTDDRFTGRGGEGYWEGPGNDLHLNVEPPRGGASGGAGAAQMESSGHRGEGPIGYAHSDDRIKESVREALGDDDHIDASHIEVVVKNGEVLLTGTVEDRRQKRLAEDVIEHLPGVEDVQNQLRVASERQPPRQPGRR